MPKRITHGEFRNKLFDIVGDEYYVQSKYINNCTKMLFKHNVCQRTFETVPDSILRGHGCPHCYSRRIPKTQEKYEQDIASKYGDEYTVVSRYINSHSPITIRHNPCGTEYTYSRAGNALRCKKKCKICSREVGNTPK